ncbi:PREDICTED: regulator of G-protein signaling 3, partial [Phaethon lepturus]|uniref:regulator of G-protein signaling 3 n=1 Tax=Phaethon lepturus TaxID=97097 RepID=UPI000530A4E1
MLETDTEKPGQMHSEDGKAAAACAIADRRLDSTFSQSTGGMVGSTTDGEDEEEEEEEEDEDEEYEEEDSDEHYLERNEAKRSSMIETSGCQPVYTLSVQSSLRRRT